jgi:predicted nucleic acid-binding protein
MGKTDGLRQIVVTDAGPLIHLHEIACLSLLSDFARVLVPDTVWNEVSKHRLGALSANECELFRLKPAEGPSAELRKIARLYSLHRGEIEALNIALQEPVDFLLTDDAAARLAASQLGLAVHGTIGILLRAIREGLRTRDDILAVLNSLPTASTLHLKRSLLDEVISAVERRE